MSKKLCLDERAAARLPPELPLELVCLILSFLFVDDIGNHDSASARCLGRGAAPPSCWLKLGTKKIPT